MRATLLAACTVLAFAACAGQNASLPLGATNIAATLRQNPTTLNIALSQPQAQYAYVDAVSVAGTYPSPASFSTWFNSLNPTITQGPCATIAAISVATIGPTNSPPGFPTAAIAYYPTAVGSCSEVVNLGDNQTGTINVTVTR